MTIPLFFPVPGKSIVTHCADQLMVQRWATMPVNARQLLNKIKMLDGSRANSRV